MKEIYGMGRSKPTRFKELGWTYFGQGLQASFVDMETGQLIGPTYESITELRCDIERFYSERFSLFLLKDKKVNRILCQSHPNIDYKTAWGCPDCVKDLRGQVNMLREALVRAHCCATIRKDGNCDGCFVSEALADTENK